MRAVIVAMSALVVAALIGAATTMFRPSADDAPLEPITVEAPADVAPEPSAAPSPAPRVPPAPVPDARTQLPAPPADVPPPPPAIDGGRLDDDFDDDWDDDGDDDDD